MPVPLATYRVQMLRRLPGFDKAAAVAGYLRDLVSEHHLYASPYLQAGSGSTHGYHRARPPCRTTNWAGWKPTAGSAAPRRGRGWATFWDIVPNHGRASASRDGRRSAWDVLENGQSSRYARYFDRRPAASPRPSSARHRPDADPGHDHYGREVEAGHVRIGRDGGTFTFRYFDHVMPVHRAPVAQRPAQRGCPAGRVPDELAFLADSFGNSNT